MRQAIIVAHGSPSDPAPQEAALRALAQRVGALLPDWQVRGATLAADGSLAAALRGFDRPVIYPFFMAEGWFTGKELPRRLDALATDRQQIAPFGLDPDLPALIAEIVTESAVSAGIEPKSSALILAAHGSKVARRSKDSAYAMAEKLAGLVPFAHIEVALIEEPPFLTDVAGAVGRGLCLPFFALRAGHVEGDIPEALAKAGFGGPCLQPIGEHYKVPALIAAALRRARP